MKLICEIIKLEIKKIIYQPKKVIYLTLMFMFFIFACIAFVNLIMLPNITCNTGNNVSYNIEQRDYYKTLYEYSYGIITELPQDFTIPFDLQNNKEFYHENYLRYEHYVETETNYCSYINLQYLHDSAHGLEGGVFLVYLGNMSFYIIATLSIVLAQVIVYDDFDKKTIKNYVQSQIKLRSIIIGKILFLIISIFIIVSMMSIIGIIVANANNETSVLVINLKKGDVKELSTSIYFMAKMMMNLFIGISIAAMTLFIRVFINKRYLSGFIAFGIIGASFGLFEIYSFLHSNEIASMQNKKYFIFINSQTDNLIFSDFSFYLMVFVYVFITLIMMRASYKNIIERDVLS